MILDTVSYTDVSGQRNDHTITVYALSTCGFCKRALAFLNDNKFAYRYIYVDQIPLETKNEIKEALKNKFKVNIAFPFAVIDDLKYLVGFVEADWKKELGVD